MKARSPLLLLCALAGCSSPLVGTWSNATQTLSFADSGHVVETDTSFPAATLAQLDPTNPNGFKFDGKYATKSGQLVLDGNDGLYPKASVSSEVESTSYELDGDTLATQLYVATTPSADLTTGTWQSTTTTTLNIVGSASTINVVDSELAFNHDIVTRTDTTTGTNAATGTTVITGIVEQSGKSGTTLFWPGSTQPLDTAYELVRPGVLSAHVFHRQD